ncbi:hypothetical protein RND71_010747 [Anisodus tanguticus]|uniref:Uncharacterized protein n=1 Tax=Anisodus tanguticus TaxID=243964 RepID=A0AAE1VJE3_9SOLA|nr:hypothetical protein RND71_010747 [Anisodus tanguticus]
MRGAVLAFPDQDRSHTRSVRDRPPQPCIDRKAGGTAPQPRGVVTSRMSPLIPDMLWYPGVGRSGSSPYRRGATAASGSIYLLGNSSGDFTVAKEAPRSIKHFR